MGVIHLVDAGNLSVYEKPFRAISEQCAQYGAGKACCPEALESVYFLSLEADESLRHGVRATRTRSSAASERVWALALAYETPSETADAALFETFLGALEYLAETGADGVLCDPHLAARLSKGEIEALGPADHGDGRVRLTVDLPRLDTLVHLAGLSRPIAYRVDPEEATAFESLSALERLFGDLHDRIAAEPGRQPQNVSRPSFDSRR